MPALVSHGHAPYVGTVSSFMEEVISPLVAGLSHGLAEGFEGGAVGGPLGMLGGHLGNGAGLIPPPDPFGVGHVAWFKVGLAHGLDGAIKCHDVGLEAFLGFLRRQ